VFHCVCVDSVSDEEINRETKRIIKQFQRTPLIDGPWIHPTFGRGGNLSFIGDVGKTKLEEEHERAGSNEETGVTHGMRKNMAQRAFCFQSRKRISWHQHEPGSKI